MSRKANIALSIALAALLVAGGIAIYLVWKTPGLRRAPQPTPSPTPTGPQPEEPIATVRGREISYEQFWDKLEQARQRLAALDPTELLGLKYTVLRRMMEDLAVELEAEERGITVTEEEVDKHITELVDQSIAQQFGGDPQRLEQFLKARGQSEAEYRAEERARIAKDRDAVRRSALRKKLAERVAQVKVSDDDVRKFWREIRIRRIVFRAGDVEPGKPPRPVSEAKKRAEQALAELDAGKDFAEVAKAFSEEPEEAARGGLFTLPGSKEEWIPRLRAVPARENEVVLYPVFDYDFERFVFRLKKGEVSKIFQTERPKPDGGLEIRLHIVKVIDERLNPPRDLARRMDDYRQVIEQIEKRVRFLDWLDKLPEEMEFVVLDPELEGYRLQLEGKFNQALAKYDQALALYPEDRLPILHAMAVCHNAELEYDEAEKLLEQLVEEAPDEVSFRVEYALFLHQRARLDDAQKQLAQAAKAAGDDEQKHLLILAVARRIGASEVATEEQKKLAELLGVTPTPEAKTPAPRGTPRRAPAARAAPQRPAPRPTPARPAVPTPVPPASTEPGGWIPSG